MTPFARSYERLLRERQATTLLILAGMGVLFCGWLAWLVAARIAVYEVSTEARIELESASLPVAAALGGRVVATHFRLGQSVKQGQLLVELDALPEQLAERAEQARASGLEEQLVPARAQIAAELAAREQERRSARFDAREAEGLAREAQVSANATRQELGRLRALEHEGLLSGLELERREAQAAAQGVALARLEGAVAQTPQRQALRERERDVRIERLRSELARLESEQAASHAETARLGYEVERRRIRAPADGRVGEAVPLQPGAVIEEGERLGSVIPTGDYVVIAQYAPEAALGRIQSGQPALLRLQGFPWADFGTVSAVVTAVAEEVRAGTVRVECALASGSSFRGRLEHGMPGTLEVTVDRRSPLALLSGRAGRWLATSE